VPLTTIAVDGSGKSCALVGDARGGLTLISLCGREGFFRVPNAHRGHVQVGFKSGNLTGDSTGDLTSDSTGDLIGDLTGASTGDSTGDLTSDLIGDLTGASNGDLTSDLPGGHVQDVWMFGEGSSVVAYTADSSRDSGVIRR
jgi:hypothetical protein